MTEEISELLLLIEEHCTTEQITAVLRGALGNKNVKLSADSKEDLVQINLRAALTSHSLDIERVYDLLREAEENGPQHIFYFRCPTKDVTDTLTLEHARKYLGANPLSKPRFDVKRNDFLLADVRAWNSRKPLDWVAKFYGHEERELPTGEVIRDGPSRSLHVYSLKEFRYVLLARWNSPDILELRVPRDSSIQRVDSWIATLRSNLRSVIPLDRFSPWEVRPICETLFRLQEAHKKLFRLGDSQLEDPKHNLITFRSYDPDGDLFGAKGTSAAALYLLENESTYRNQRVLWLQQPDAGITMDISTVIGVRAGHEVIFARHQSSRGIDHVTSQLRTFSKR